MKKSQQSSQVSLELQGDQHNSHAADVPGADSVSVSASSSDGRKVSRQDIELVQNLIERCLQLYMNRDEVVKTLLTRARIDPGFTTLVWQKLEEENADFFRAYYIRLKLKKQIVLFNHLLEHQYNLMKYPVPPKLPMPVNNMPMGYPVMQQPPMGHPCGVSSCHVVNGVPAPGGYHPMLADAAADANANATPAIPPKQPENPVSPASVASSGGNFPFTTPEISGMGVESAALDQIQWNFSLSDLTADLSNLGELGSLGIYPGSPFLPSDSEILLESPDHEDIEEFFADSFPGQASPSDEERPQ